jgi:hypothetical protein
LGSGLLHEWCHSCGRKKHFHHEWRRWATRARTCAAKGSYEIGAGQGPGKPDAKPWVRTTGRSESFDGWAAGLQAPDTEGFAF